MKQISLLISDIYNKYLPLSKDRNVELNLSAVDTASELDAASDIEEIQENLDEHMQKLLNKSRHHGVISLGIQQDYIVIRDSDTILSPLMTAALSHGRVEVKSRVGFGTTIYISIKSKSDNEQTAEATKKTKDKKLPE